MKLFLALILLFVSLVRADGLDEKQTIQEVAVHALKNAFEQPNGQYWEYGGMIIYHNGKLGYSKPVTVRSDHGTNIPVETVMKDDVLMGVFHTHPCRPDTFLPKYFSRLDMRLPFVYHVPAFILDECTGQVHEFDPAVDKLNENGDWIPMDNPWGVETSRFLTYGRIVGNIGAIGINLDEEGIPTTDD